MRAFITLACLGLLLAGCATSTVETRKKERASAYAGLPAEQKTFVDQGKIQIGMTADAVYLAWGAPAKTMDITTAGVPLAPNASNTPKAPIAPTIPATRDQPIPRPG